VVSAALTGPLCRSRPPPAGRIQIVGERRAERPGQDVRKPTDVTPPATWLLSSRDESHAWSPAWLTGPFFQPAAPTPCVLRSVY
jgi:hypothetical protein